MSFEQINILEDPMPLDTKAFDVVHLRYTLLHVSHTNYTEAQSTAQYLGFLLQLPDGQSLLPRLASLVASSGFLLLDEWNIRDLEINTDTTDIQLTNAPGIQRCITVWAGFMRSRGGDPGIGPKLKPWLEEMSDFEKVRADEVTLPLHPVPTGKSSRWFILFSC